MYSNDSAAAAGGAKGSRAGNLKTGRNKAAGKRTAKLGSVFGELPEEYEARLIFPGISRIRLRIHQPALSASRRMVVGTVTGTVLPGGCSSTGATMSFFPHVQVQEKEELVTELALGRLLYPKELSEKFREQYQTYIREHWEMAGRLLIQADNMKKNHVSNLEPGKLPWLVRRGAYAKGSMRNLAARTLAAEQLGIRNKISRFRISLPSFPHLFR